MDNKITNILIVGVGGQGIVLAGDLITSAARAAGFDAKAAEIHGMSQRGGSVLSEVRYGKEIFSPIMPAKGADIILAFELLEGLRTLPRLKEGGIIIVNDQKIMPSSVTYGAGVYPEDCKEQILNSGKKSIILDALSIAAELGNQRAVNSVIMGVMAQSVGIDLGCWEQAIRALVKPQYIDVNLKAFESGYNFGHL